ncbi:MAG: hypothetical protein Q9165_006099 [Trypethelium subeluteriae]
MARPQSELFIPNHFTTVPPSSVGNSTFFSEACLTEAIARPKGQDSRRRWSNRPAIGSLSQISTARTSIGSRIGRERILSPRLRSLSTQRSRPNLGSNSSSSLKDRKGRRATGHNEEHPKTEIHHDYKPPAAKQNANALGANMRVSVFNTNTSVTQRVVKFEELANQTESTNKESTEDVPDVVEPAFVFAKEIFRPKRINNKKAKQIPLRPMSNSQTPTKMYQSLEHVIEKETDPLVNSKATGMNESAPAFSPTTTLGSTSEDLESNKYSDITALPLRSGSVLTVVRPEQTAWQRVVYFQGPIKLLNQDVLTRKASIASMYAFQDAVEQGADQRYSFSQKSIDDEMIDDLINFFESLDIEPEFQEWDMSSIECRTPKTELSFQTVDKGMASAEMAVVAEVVPSVVESVSMSRRKEPPPRLHLDLAERTRAASKSPGPGPQGNLKRFNSSSKKRPYKRTTLGRLTSII